MVKELRKNNVMSKMSRQPIGDWEQIMVKDDYLTMVGSSSAPNEPRLQLIHLWGKIDKLDDIPKDLNEDAVFNINNHNFASRHSNDRRSS